MSFTPHELDRLADAVADRLAAKLLDQPKLVDRVELARVLGVSVPTIERLSAAGSIPVVRMGRRVLFDPAAVIAARSEQKGGGDHAQ
jgi:excisionase family DNA binding protein